MSRADQTPQIGSDFSTSSRRQPRSISHHFRRVNFNNSTLSFLPLSLPITAIRFRVAMTRTIFPAAFNYPRTRAPTSERTSVASQNIDRRARSLSLLPLAPSNPLAFSRDDRRVRGRRQPHRKRAEREITSYSNENARYRPQLRLLRRERFLEKYPSRLSTNWTAIGREIPKLPCTR
jgi:hypothetical protein